MAKIFQNTLRYSAALGGLCADGGTVGAAPGKQPLALIYTDSLTIGEDHPIFIQNVYDGETLSVVGDLPRGLSLNTSINAITGTLDGGGIIPFDLVATDTETGATRTGTFTISVAPEFTTVAEPAQSLVINGGWLETSNLGSDVTELEVEGIFVFPETSSAKIAYQASVGMSLELQGTAIRLTVEDSQGVIVVPTDIYGGLTLSTDVPYHIKQTVSFLTGTATLDINGNRWVRKMNPTANKKFQSGRSFAFFAMHGGISKLPAVTRVANFVVRRNGVPWVELSNDPAVANASGLKRGTDPFLAYEEVVTEPDPTEPPPPEPTDPSDYSMALAAYTDPTATGPTIPASQMKRPGIDPMPPGATYNASLNQIRLGGGSGDIVFDGWYFHNIYIYATHGDNRVDIKNSILRLDDDTYTVGGIDIRSNGPVYIDRVRLVGPGWFNGRPTPVRSTPTQASWLEVTRSVFTGWGSDHIKSTGPGLIQGNLFDVPINLPFEPVNYSPSATYNTGDLVWGSNGKAYEALQDGIVGVEPTTDSVKWKKRDPHADNVNPAAQWDETRAMTVTDNFFNRAAARPLVDPMTLYGDVGYTVGHNNNLRSSPNTGSGALRHTVIFEKNIVTGGQNGFAFPVDFGNLENYPPEDKSPQYARYNWYDARDNYTLVHTNSLVGNVVENNVDDFDFDTIPARPREDRDGNLI